MAGRAGAVWAALVVGLAGCSSARTGEVGEGVDAPTQFGTVDVPVDSKAEADVEDGGGEDGEPLDEPGLGGDGWEAGDGVQGDAGDVGGEPAAVVAPEALEFGEVIGGQTKTLAVTVTNAGGGSLVVVVAVEAEGSAFSTEAGTLVLGASESGDVAVTFKPALPGEATGTLVLTTNAAGADEVVVPMSGTGIAAGCAGVTCSTPPAAACVDAGSVRTWSGPGECVGKGECSYPWVDTACAGGEVCEAGACVPACDGEGCVDTCEGAVEVRVSDDAHQSSGPWTLWTGSQHVVLWLEIAEADGQAWNYRLATLDAGGGLVGAPALAVGSGTVAHPPRAAWSGSEVGIAFSDVRTGSNQMYFQRVTPLGAPVGGELQLTSTTALAFTAGVGWNPQAGEYLLGWRDDGPAPATMNVSWLHVARVTGDGQLVGGDAAISGGEGVAEYPSIVWTGSEYGVAWNDTRDGNLEIYFARLDGQGTKIGGDVRVSEAAGTSYAPSLVWTGQEYAVAWYDDRDGLPQIRLARLSAAGQKLGGDVQVATTADIPGPSLVWTGGQYAVAWSDKRDGTTRVYLAHLSAAGQKLGPDQLVSCGAAKAQGPSLTWTGGQLAVSWTDFRHPSTEIYFRLLEP